MLRTAAVLVGDISSAEEVVQDAFVSMFRSWHRIKRAPAGYLHRSVVNGARSRLRRRSVADQARPIPIRMYVQSAEDVAVRGLVSGPLVTALRALSPREREVVLLRYYLDLSEQQTAEALGLRRGSVKAYASRGLAALRGTLDDLSEFEGLR
jgi:RNA polymerase sigma-70 factor (sigma-E family)